MIVPKLNEKHYVSKHLNRNVMSSFSTWQIPLRFVIQFGVRMSQDRKQSSPLLYLVNPQKKNQSDWSHAIIEQEKENVVFLFWNLVKLTLWLYKYGKNLHVQQGTYSLAALISRHLSTVDYQIQTKSLFKKQQLNKQ